MLQATYASHQSALDRAEARATKLQAELAEARSGSTVAAASLQSAQEVEAALGAQVAELRVSVMTVGA